jgi:hypothetical protein
VQEKSGYSKVELHGPTIIVVCVRDQKFNVTAISSWDQVRLASFCAEMAWAQRHKVQSWTRSSVRMLAAHMT